jgi:hypothetical protein
MTMGYDYMGLTLWLKRNTFMFGLGCMVVFVISIPFMDVVTIMAFLIA